MSFAPYNVREPYWTEAMTEYLARSNVTDMSVLMIYSNGAGIRTEPGQEAFVAALFHSSTKGPWRPYTGSKSGIAMLCATLAFRLVSSALTLQKLLSHFRECWHD